MAVTSEDVRAATALVLSDRNEHRHARADSLLARMRELVRRLFERRHAFAGGSAPAVPSSVVYELCRQYEAHELWERYYAFRLDPGARTWRPLRRQVVPWLAGRRVMEVMQPLEPFNGRRTPDSDSLKRTLLAFSAAPRQQSSFSQTVRTQAHRPRR